MKHIIRLFILIAALVLGADHAWADGESNPRVKFVYVDENGFEVGNVDATIIAQAPKMSPHIDTMRRNIADALGLDVSQVSVKATTEERLGFTGRGEGISAQAVALIL